MRYEVALNIRFLSAGIYTAGAYIYRKENGSKELIKVSSLYLHAKSKRQAAIITINTIKRKQHSNVQAETTRNAASLISNVPT